MTELPITPDPTASRQPPVILIVEDHADLRKLIRLTFLGTDYRLHEASSGDEAMARIPELRPDLVILDVMMPGTLNGYQVCRRVKDDPALRHTCVMLVTARAQLDDIEQGRQAGADHYLIKPFSPMELLEQVGGILGS
ncbi:response regulator [Deinococcus seoulensis]|uniref:Response regulator n=2 Tax=Deinococcus TaxID=1298 RepID=A0ABQ2RTJ2_9DEIO|nr:MULTISPECIES: response regulator [Deinococcus]GGR64479.1 response regulator [Deinococcus seoulensis]GGS21934.1 response regulator [Deinococcus knuensis]